MSESDLDSVDGATTLGCALFDNLPPFTGDRSTHTPASAGAALLTHVNGQPLTEPLRVRRGDAIRVKVSADAIRIETGPPIVKSDVADLALILREMAHEYLDAAIDANRAYMANQPDGGSPSEEEDERILLRRTICLDAAVEELMRQCSFGYWAAEYALPGSKASGVPEYIAKVKADFDARVRGERGGVPE